MTEAVEHYKINELADCGRDGKAYSTRNRKTLVLNSGSGPVAEIGPLQANKKHSFLSN